MTLVEAKKIIAEIIERYKVNFCDYHEEHREGKVKFIHLVIKLKIEE